MRVHDDTNMPAPLRGGQHQIQPISFDSDLAQVAFESYERKFHEMEAWTLEGKTLEFFITPEDFDGFVADFSESCPGDESQKPAMLFAALSYRINQQHQRHAAAQPNIRHGDKDALHELAQSGKLMEMYRAIAASLGRHLPDVSWRDVEALIDHFRDETTYVRRNIPARERTVGALGPFTVKGVSVTTAHSELALASS